MDKILTAQDFAKSEGYENARARVEAKTRKGYDTPPQNGSGDDAPVFARVDFGRWIADCECGGAEAVDPDDAFFYCLSCGNNAINGRIRSVIFPDASERAQIEALLLARPVKSMRGRNAFERATMAEPAIIVEGRGPLSRSWNPDESIDDLKEQNKAIKKGKR